MGQFDQFANQGGPAAEDADALAKARRITDEQLRNADYSVDLPEPLGGERPAADEQADPGEDRVDGATAGTIDSHAEEHARRLLSGEGAPIDDAPTDPSRADSSARSDDSARTDDSSRSAD